LTADSSDSGLVRAVCLGDDRAFEIIVHRYERSIRRICARRLRGSEDVEEAVQDTFIKAYRAFPAMECENLGGWLARIAGHVCIDRIRRDATRPSSIPIVAGGWAATVAGPEDIVAVGDPRVDVALEALSEDHRTAVELRFMYDLSHQEMAAAMSKSASQVKALVHRAKARLRAEWAVA
jgi:RNA polymerase sigma-70 factor, ECF subfamily